MVIQTESMKGLNCPYKSITCQEGFCRDCQIYLDYFENVQAEDFVERLDFFLSEFERLLEKKQEIDDKGLMKKFWGEYERLLQKDGRSDKVAGVLEAHKAEQERLDAEYKIAKTTTHQQEIKSKQLENDWRECMLELLS